MDRVTPLTNYDIVAGILGKFFLVQHLYVRFTSTRPTNPKSAEETFSQAEIALLFLVKGYLFALRGLPLDQSLAKMILMSCQTSTWVKVNLCFMILEFLMGCGAPNQLGSVTCFALFFYDLSILFLFVNRIKESKKY